MTVSIEEQLAEARAIRERNASLNRLSLEYLQELREGRESFGLTILDIQRTAAEAVAVYDDLSPKEIDGLEPNSLVYLARKQAGLIESLTNECIRRSVTEQKYFDAQAEAIKGKLELHELDQRINADQERLVALAKNALAYPHS